MRQGARLLRNPVVVRAADLRARTGRGRPRDGGLQAGLLPPRAGSLRRADRDEAVARDAQEPEAAQAAGCLSGREDQALLQTRPRTASPALPARSRLIDRDPRIGEVYLTAAELRARIAELGAEIERDYAGSELPLLVGSLKASLIFLTDLSRSLRIPHALDFIELAGY